MAVKSEKIIIGTRGSPLALWQARTVQAELVRVRPDIEFEIRTIRTSGDWRPEDGEAPLKESEGGKGQFAKEIEAALLAGDIDLGVHSMKDMETAQPGGLVIPWMLPREDARDCFLSNNAQNIGDLPVGSVVGTTSARRAAFLLHRRPDLRIVPLRGNVRTRIDKLRARQVDATLLACAGLKRLGLMGEVSSVLSAEEMLPAVGQGAIGIEIRGVDKDNLSFISQITCEKTYACVESERSVLRELGGSCHTPIGVYAYQTDKEMRLRAHIITPDGRQAVYDEVTARVEDVQEARELGKNLALCLRPGIPDGVL